MASKAEEQFEDQYGRKPKSADDWKKVRAMHERGYGGQQPNAARSTAERNYTAKVTAGQGGRTAADVAASRRKGSGESQVGRRLPSVDGDSTADMFQKPIVSSQQSFEDRLRAIGEEEQQIRGMLAPNVPGMPDFGGPILQTAPDLGSYVRPYDDASAGVTAMHGQVRPQIDSQYAALAAALQERVGAGQVRNEQTAGQLAAALQAAQGTSAANWRGSEQSLAAHGALGVGNIAGAAEAEQQAAQSQLAAQFAAQQSLAANVGASNNESNQARVSEADMAKQAALANADTNMQAALAKIGMGRADAESQYAQDAASTSQANARLQQEYAQGQWENQMATEQATREDRAARQQLWNENLSQPGESFLARAPQLRQEMPAAYSGLMDILSANAEGGTLASAMAMIDDDSMADLGEDEKSRLAQWLKEYYADQGGSYSLDRQKQAFANAGYIEGGY